VICARISGDSGVVILADMGEDVYFFPAKLYLSGNDPTNDPTPGPADLNRCFGASISVTGRVSATPTRYGETDQTGADR
jgi:hypothetical protein